MTLYKKVIKKIDEDYFLLNKNASLLKIIEFSFILHSHLIEVEYCKNDYLYEFSLDMYIRMEEELDNNDNNSILLHKDEIKKLLIWLDFICKLIINSEGEHNSSSFIKQFILFCDNFFKELKKVTDLNSISN